MNWHDGLRAEVGSAKSMAGGGYINGCNLFGEYTAHCAGEFTGSVGRDPLVEYRSESQKIVFESLS